MSVKFRKKPPGFVFQQRQLERTKEEITDRVEKSERTMEKLRKAADVIRVSVILTHSF